jgi:hypothetical protein
LRRREWPQIVRKVFAAFDRDDIEAVLRLCDEDIVITQPAEVPGINPQQQSGVEVDMEFSFVFTLRDEKLIEWRGLRPHSARRPPSGPFRHSLGHQLGACGSARLID